MTEKRVLITGIEGFVGPYLAKLLLEQGHEVHGTFLENSKESIQEVKYVHLDITDKQENETVISEIKPEWIIHLAGFSSVGQSWKNPELCNKVNVVCLTIKVEAKPIHGQSPEAAARCARYQAFLSVMKKMIASSRPITKMIKPKHYYCNYFVAQAQRVWLPCQN